MKCVIPYKQNGGVELKYCLRGIEKFVKNPEVILIGSEPDWIQNVKVIPFPDGKQFRFKEWNIFRKICEVNRRAGGWPPATGDRQPAADIGRVSNLSKAGNPKQGFLFFNDDHFLLQPFDKNTYHFSGKLSQILKEYGTNQYAHTIQNTINAIGGDADNYFRHGPLFIRPEILEKINELKWDAPWGYCVKSLYCHYAGIKGTEYPDLKIRASLPLSHIQKLTEGRDYFSTGNYAVNKDMIAFLEETYPEKSKFEK